MLAIKSNSPRVHLPLVLLPILVSLSLPVSSLENGTVASPTRLVGFEYQRKRDPEEKLDFGNFFKLDSFNPPVIALKHPSYLIVVPRIVRAGYRYKIVVNLVPPSPPLEVRATLFRDNIRVEMAEGHCESHEPQVLTIMVPLSSHFGDYSLKLEGNEVGWLTGTAFTQEVALQFRPRGAAISIQTDKAIYQQDSEVKLRIMALDLSARVVDDSVDVFVLSPRGVLVKMWLSRQSREGAISLQFPLSANAEEGKWTVRAEAFNSFAEKQFLLEKFHPSRFELNVVTPAFLSTDNDFLRGTVYANYSSGAPVTGNISVRAALKPFDSGAFALYGSDPDLVLARNEFSGTYRFKFRLSDFDYILSNDEGAEVVITATVADTLWETSATGFGSTRIFNPKIILKFVGDSPQILRPPMPFKFCITASLADGSHLSSFRLARHRLLVSPAVRMRSGTLKRLQPRSVKMTHDQYGLWDDEIDLQSELGATDDVTSMKLEAELKDSMGRKFFASLETVTFHSLQNRYVQVTTSSKRPKVGEYGIFHVRTNFYLEKFRFLILSKGLMLHCGQESMEASIKSFPVELTPFMAGSATILVYALERGKEMVADALIFPVEALTSQEISVRLQEQPSNGMMKVTVKGQPGSRIFLTGVHWSSFQLQAGNEISPSEIIRQMNFEPSDQVLLQQVWLSHNGLPEEVLRIPRSSSAADVNQTLSSCGLLVVSDGETPHKETPCHLSRGFLPCLSGGCFPNSSRCDRKWDCLDRSDEQNCPGPPAELQKDLISFKMNRRSKTLSSHFCDPWIWTDVVLDNEGAASVSVTSPERASKLVLSAFSIGPDNSIAFLKEPVMLTTSPPYWMSIEAPSRVGIWEQVGIRVTLVNQISKELLATVRMVDNPKYQFPRPPFRAPYPSTTNEVVQGRRENYHRVSIPLNEARSIYLPIVPISTGNIIVTVEVEIQEQKTVKSVAIFVEPMGALQERHTSFMVDLNNRAYLFTFLDLQVPFQKHLPDAKAHLTLFGDTVGGVEGDFILDPLEALSLPEIGCDSLVFSMRMTTENLNRWKKLNQSPDKDEKKIFQQLSSLYQSLLSFQNSDGGFRFFRTSDISSVWLSASVLHCLNVISTSWPQLIYIDPQVIDKALKFVLSQQATHGAFLEPSGTVGIRHLESPSSFALTEVNTRGLNLSTTALTLIRLQALRGIPEPLDRKLQSSLTRGVGWLEDNLELVAEVSKPLEVALVALATHLLKSKKREDSFAILSRTARREGEQFVYWGEDHIPLPSYRVEDNRPHLEPKVVYAHDSGNVAATACGLWVYALRRELLTLPVVRWLQSQRLHDGGWISTFDTILAWEALKEYSDIQNTAKNTRLAVTVEPMVELSTARVFYLTPSNLLTLQTHQVGNKLGSITVQGKGRGSAVLQLHLQYYVTDWKLLRPPPRKSFSLETLAISSGKNASMLSFRSCVKWIPISGSESSGISVLELTIPTGYGIDSMRLEEYVQSRQVPELREAKFRSRMATFIFDKIGPSDTCIKITLDRWFPVANLTRILPAKVYEYYSPESFAIELVDMSSVTLDICQVCGSYECQNCPVLSYYSSQSIGDKTSTSANTVPLVIVWVFYINLYHLLDCR